VSQRLRVLCVDDSEDDADLNVLALKRHGYDVESVRVDRREAAGRELISKQWDVVLCDFQMPHFSANGLLELVAEGQYDIPVLIVSGAVGEEAAAEMIRLGAYDYVFKSRIKRLGSSVERALRDAEIRRGRRAMEEQLRSSETRLRLIFEQLPALVVTTDTELTITSVEGARLAAIGMEGDQLVGSRIGTSPLIADESRFPIRRAHLRALQGGAGEFEIIWGGKTLQGHVEPLRGTDGRVGSHLSGGLDSSAVTATAARLLGPDGRVTAFTSAPFDTR